VRHVFLHPTNRRRAAGSGYYFRHASPGIERYYCLARRYLRFREPDSFTVWFAHGQPESVTERLAMREPESISDRFSERHTESFTDRFSERNS